MPEKRTNRQIFHDRMVDEIEHRCRTVPHAQDWQRHGYGFTAVLCRSCRDLIVALTEHLITAFGQFVCFRDPACSRKTGTEHEAHSAHCTATNNRLRGISFRCGEKGCPGHDLKVSTCS